MDDFEEFLRTEEARMQTELDVHLAIIAEYDAVIKKWEKIKNFLLAGTIISVIMIVVTVLNGNEALNFASKIITIISIVAMSVHLIVMTYYTYKTGRQYDLMTKIIEKSIKRNQEWVKSLIES